MFNVEGIEVARMQLIETCGTTHLHGGFQFIPQNYGSSSQPVFGLGRRGIMRLTFNVIGYTFITIIEGIELSPSYANGLGTQA